MRSFLKQALRRLIRYSLTIPCPNNPFPNPDAITSLSSVGTSGLLSSGTSCTMECVCVVMVKLRNGCCLSSPSDSLRLTSFTVTVTNSSSILRSTKVQARTKSHP